MHGPTVDLSMSDRTRDIRSALRRAGSQHGVAACAASIALVLSGCTVTRTVANDLLGGSSAKVPTRTAVAASTTQTATNGAALNGVSTTKTASANEAVSVDASGWDTTPLTRRNKGATAGLAGDANLANDNGMTDGGGNLAQVSFATEGGDYAPDVDRTGTFMVYASTQHRPTFDIYRKSVDGRTVTQLTMDPSDDLMPSLAPDGSRLAFASNRNGNWDIYVMPIGGGAPTQLTSDTDDEVQPTWAPDGRRIAFSRKNGRTNTWEIWIVDTQNPGLRSYVCEGFLPRWSPNEKSDVILFQRARQRGTRLYGVWTIELVQGEGLSPTEIVSAKNSAVLQPSWSPDGGKICFTSVVNPGSDSDWPEQSDIWIVNADGTGRIGLTNGRFRNMQPSWGADGRVYFVSNRGGIENIWSIAADGGQKAAGSVEFAAKNRAQSKDLADGKSKPVASHTAATAGQTELDATPELLRAGKLAGAEDEKSGG